MSIWVEIKKALNSSIGTEDFEPLDVMIRGQKTFAGDDDIICSISSSSITTSHDFSKKFKSLTNGTVNVISDGRGTASSARTLRIYVNGELAGTSDFSGTARQTIKTPINVHKNDVVSFSTSSGNGAIYSIGIGAKIVDGTLYEVIEEEG